MEAPITARRIPFRRPVVTADDDVSGSWIADEETGAEDSFLTPASVEALFRQSYASIVQSLAMAGGDLAAAEDATQEAFVQAWSRWSRISRYDNPGAWVRRVAINKLRNAHRSRLRREAALARMVPAEPAPTEPDAGLVAQLQRLPSRQRLCAVLYYVDGLSTPEVARAMGISQGAVSQHLNRARTVLRSYLEESP
jgi:RNA polymerase sigma-70 factor (ECF subfamily)